MGRHKKEKAWVRVPSAMPSASSQEHDLEAGPAQAGLPRRCPPSASAQADLSAGPAHALHAIPKLAPSVSSQGGDMDAGPAKAFAAPTELPVSASSQGRDGEGGLAHSSQHSPSASGPGRVLSFPPLPTSGSQHSPSASSQGSQTVVVACPVCNKQFAHQRDLYGWTLLQWHAWYSEWSRDDWARHAARGGYVPPSSLRCTRQWRDEDFKECGNLLTEAGSPGRRATHSLIWWP